MKIVSTRGIVVKTIDYKETSKILNILTEDYGIIGVISKGCKSPKSKLSVVSSNFTYAIFHIYYNENKLSTLIQADIIDYFSNIRNDITLVGYMTYLTELSKEVYAESSKEEVLELLISSLDRINNKVNPKIIKNILELKYLYFLGVGINLNNCVSCSSINVITLSSLKGGYVCHKCKGNEKILNEKTLKLIKMFYYVDISKISKTDIKDDIVKEIDTFLNEYYENFTGIYMKSKKFLQNLDNI